MAQTSPSLIVVVVLAATSVAFVPGCAEATGSPSTPGAASGEARIGEPAPALDAAAVRGKTRVTIPKGKVVLVDFWATWCSPCKESFPAYRDLYVKYQASGLEIVAVSADEPDAKDAIPGWVKEHGDPPFAVGWDDSQTAAKRWGVRAMPTAFLVDRSGVVRHVHTKFEGKSTIDELEKHIRELL